VNDFGFLGEDKKDDGVDGLLDDIVSTTGENAMVEKVTRN
jgi:hypothetical protein